MVSFNKREKVSFVLFCIGVIIFAFLDMLAFYIAGVVLLFVIGYSVGELVYYLAEQRILFFSVREGEAAILISGSDPKTGSFLAVKMNWNNHYIDQNGYVKIGKERKDLITILFPGVFSKIWPGQHVLEYSFEWAEIQKNLGDHGDKVVTRSEKNVTRIILRTFQYAAIWVGLETESMVPVGLTVVFSVNIVSPKIAITQNEQWLSIVMADAMGAIREFISALNDPEEVNRIIKNGIMDRNGKKLDSLGAAFLDYIKKVYVEDKKGKPIILWDKVHKEQGVSISKITTTALDLGDWAKTAIKILTAEREGQALYTEEEFRGKAFARYTELKRDALKDLFNMIGNDNALKIQYMEALQKMSENPSTKFVQLPSSLTQLAEILGDKIAKP